MKSIIEIKKILGLSISQCADLFGITYSEMADILENRQEPSKKLIRACNIVREIFLRNNNT